MKRVYQPTIDQQTQELSEQVLKDLTQRPDNNMLIDKYRELKRELKESQARDAIKEFVDKVKGQQEYKDWLALNLRKDEKRKKKKVPKDDLKRVAFYITQMKSSLPTVIPTAVFTESLDQWKRKGLWRVQDHGYLTGLAVLDADHVPNPEEIVKQWLERDDLKELGIVWIFITPSGEGVKVVFKAKVEWGNLADNYYTMAEKLGDPLILNFYLFHPLKKM